MGNIPSIRAAAVTTLGRFAERSSVVAAESLPAVGVRLRTTVAAGDPTTAAERNNLMIVWAALAAPFPHLVDRHLPSVALALSDAHAGVRRTALVVLTRLLREGLIKWNGRLFFRLLVPIVDSAA